MLGPVGESSLSLGNRCFMEERPEPQRLLAFLEASSSVRVKAQRRLERAYRRAALPQATDPRALALAVALEGVDDATFLAELVAAEQAGWPELPPPSFVRLRLAWDGSHAGDFGDREVRGWGPEHREIAGHASRERVRSKLSRVLSVLWDVDRGLARRSSGFSQACEHAPRIVFGEAPEFRLSSIRKGEPYFMSDDGFAVGAYHAWYAVDRSLVSQYSGEFRDWLAREWPEVLDVLVGEPVLSGMSFGSWTTGRIAEALVRRLTFEEAAYMIMDDQRLEDTSWI